MHAIEWLIGKGAVNNRYDPNGLIPSKEEMLSFGKSDMDWFYGPPGLRRGYSIGK